MPNTDDLSFCESPASTKAHMVDQTTPSALALGKPNAGDHRALCGVTPETWIDMDPHALTRSDVCANCVAAAYRQGLDGALKPVRTEGSTA